MSGSTAFFYGTLMAPEVLHRVVRGPTTTTESHQSLSMVRPAILHDYHRCKVRNADYPAIIPMDGACVRGSFVSGLSDAAMRRLDIFEGSEYIRRHVKLKLLEQVGDVDGKGNVEGEEVEAETYVWCSPMSELENEEWDFAEFQREKMHRWVGSCAEHPEIVGLPGPPEQDPTRGRGVSSARMTR